MYDIYGVGNAILDMEFRRINLEVLISLGIEKGVMTLVDQDRHHELLGHLGGISHVLACGGSVANSVSTAAMLGAKTFFSCRVAQDQAGVHYHNNLLEAGIDTNISSIKPSGVTGKMIGLITPDADRTMNTFLGISQETCIDDLDAQALANSKTLYVEGYLLSSSSGFACAKRAVEMAKDAGVMTSISLSDPNMVSFCIDQFNEIVDMGIDLIFGNEREAMLFTGAENIDQAIVVMKTKAPQFVITRGSDGAVVYSDGEVARVDSTPVNAIDTLGAGDTFAGTYLYALTRGQSAVQAAKLASYVAAKVVARFGPRLDPDDISELRADVDYVLSSGVTT
jgi:sugar/nucleoside kinase (ribokinase family)